MWQVYACLCTYTHTANTHTHIHTQKSTTRQCKVFAPFYDLVEANRLPLSWLAPLSRYHCPRASVSATRVCVCV